MFFGTATIHAQAIFDAIRSDDLAKVKECLEREPVCVNAVNPNGQTLLIQAVKWIKYAKLKK